MSAKMEEILKALDMYLETKRQIFPRFYFLSNDEILEILGQSQNVDAMQPHLKKCFDNIRRLELDKAGAFLSLNKRFSAAAFYIFISKLKDVLPQPEIRFKNDFCVVIFLTER